jgi:hypothetical protein
MKSHLIGIGTLLLECTLYCILPAGAFLCILDYLTTGTLGPS